MQRCRRRFVEIDIDAPALLEEERAQVIDAVGMVGMLVGVEHAVEPIDLGIEHLLAQIGRGVDQNARDRLTAACGVGRSTRSEVRRRRFFGFFGSQSPQPRAGRGTPPEEPQPRMVNFSVIAKIASVFMRPSDFVCAAVAALCRTGERNSPWSVARSRRTKRRASQPGLLRSRSHRPARCACRDIFQARDKAHRFRPGCGRPAIPRRWRATPPNS